jgi:hypothetical protein
VNVLIEVIYNGWLCEYFADFVDEENHHNTTLKLKLRRSDELALLTFGDCLIDSLENLTLNKTYCLINPNHNPNDYNSLLIDKIRIENDVNQNYQSYNGNRIKIVHYIPDDSIKTPIPQDKPTPAIESSQLAILNRAAYEFWSDVERGNKETYPPNFDVEKWLISQGITDWLAHRLPVIIRPDWAK